MDWATILQGLGGGAGPSPLGDPNFNDIVPPINTGGDTGLGTLGRGVIGPPPPTPALPPAPLTADEGVATAPVVPPSTAPVQTATSVASGPGLATRAQRKEDDVGDLGAVWTGNVPTPQPDPRKMGAGARADAGPAGPTSVGGAGGHTPLSGAKAAEAAKNSQGLAAALRGLKMPTAPTSPAVGTPAAPRPHGTIQSGGYQQLLAMLGAGGGKGAARPTTLGGSIGR